MNKEAKMIEFYDVHTGKVIGDDDKISYRGIADLDKFDFFVDTDGYVHYSDGYDGIILTKDFGWRVVKK